MNDMIKNLVEALQLSPDNVPLRLQVANLMMNDKMYAEAAEQLSEILQRSYGHSTAQVQLAECFYHMEKYSAALIIFEQLNFTELPVTSAALYVRCLIKEQSIEQAIDLYKQLLLLYPGFSDDEIDKTLRLGSSAASMDDELMMDDEAYFLEKPTTRFSDVGGMKNVKNEISLKIIQPLKNPDLYKAFGKKAGGGILLYGPPGCGKTFIAKATAGEIDAKFISIGLHDILDMWIGNSEKNLHQVFEVARANKPCVLFFDEVDAIGSSRADLKQSAMRHVINQFLAELDGVEANNEGVLILAATNAPWSVDGAFRRPGRFDRIIFVAPPDEEARIDILKNLLNGKPVGEVDVKKIAAQSEGYSGADLTALIDIAVEDKLTQSIETGELQPLTTKDFLRALKIHKPTTQEWFASARNYALYANESGLYDDILKYLKIKR
ncbi:tetratricopeptide repeat protein [Lacibacter sp. H407]|uniref:tetratricopeptide repeat protein n=1 Tax=Lacibacter sp. H407 TaxID=3133423 RepID=UPI0030C2851B